MPEIIELPTFTDERGSLTVIEKSVPFVIKRTYFIYHCNHHSRGGHRHHQAIQAAVCIRGSCIFDIQTPEDDITIALNEPNKLLLLECRDWHLMRDFTDEAILLVLSSEYYDVADYIDEAYR